MSRSKSEEPRIILLDGGMGTTLESAGYDVSSPLWGSEMIASDPAAIRGVHEGYVKAGADLVETATYQLTPSNLAAYLSQGSEQCHAGSAWRLMHRSVALVSDAIDAIDPGADLSHDGGDAEPGRQRDEEAVRERRRPGVVLSCGPYGSTLSPGQEYGGVYPPPYGPGRGSNVFPPSDDGHRSTDSKLNDASKYIPASSPGTGAGTVASSDAEAEAIAIEHLAAYHLDKLRTFAMDEPTWRAIEWVAFETIPVLHEIRAIRVAMRRLGLSLERTYGGGQSGRNDGQRGVWRWVEYDVKPQDQSGGEGDMGNASDAESDGAGAASDLGRPWWDKKFWITSPFPDGVHPQRQLRPPRDHSAQVSSSSSTSQTVSQAEDGTAAQEAGGRAELVPVPVEKVVEAMLGDEAGMSKPDGIGINCTHPKNLASLSREFSAAHRSLSRSADKRAGGGPSGNGGRVRFVLYPDGGQVYDTVTREWSNASSPTDAHEWACDVMDIVRKMDRAPTSDPARWEDAYQSGNMSDIGENLFAQVEKEATGLAGSRESGERDTRLWGGVIVGGCCKTSFDEIAALRRAIDRDKADADAEAGKEKVCAV